MTLDVLCSGVVCYHKFAMCTNSAHLLHFLQWSYRFRVSLDWQRVHYCQCKFAVPAASRPFESFTRSSDVCKSVRKISADSKKKFSSVKVLFFIYFLMFSVYTFQIENERRTTRRARRAQSAAKSKKNKMNSLNVFLHELPVELRTQWIVNEICRLIRLGTGAILEHHIIIPASFNFRRARLLCWWIIQERISTEDVLHANALLLLGPFGVAFSLILCTFTLDLVEFGHERCCVVVGIRIIVRVVAVNGIVCVRILFELLTLCVRLESTSDGRRGRFGRRWRLNSFLAFFELFAEVTAADFVACSLASFSKMRRISWDSSKDFFNLLILPVFELGVWWQVANWIMLRLGWKSIAFLSASWIECWTCCSCHCL